MSTRGRALARLVACLSLISLPLMGCPACGEFVGRPATVVGEAGPTSIAGGGFAVTNHRASDGSQDHEWDRPRVGGGYAIISALPFARDRLDVSFSIMLPWSAAVRYQFLDTAFDASCDVGFVETPSFSEAEGKVFVGINLSPHASSYVPYLSLRCARGVLHVTYGPEGTYTLNGESLWFEEYSIFVGVTSLPEDSDEDSWSLEASYSWPGVVMGQVVEVENRTFGIRLLRSW